MTMDSAAADNYAACVAPEAVLNDDDWLASAWFQLDARIRWIVERRIEGATLDAIGKSVGLTRERVRQLTVHAAQFLSEAQHDNLPDLDDYVLEVFEEDRAAVSEVDLDHVIQTSATAARRCLLESKGVVWIVNSGVTLVTLWPDILKKRIRLLADAIPMTEDEVSEAAEELGLPTDPAALDGILETARLMRTDLGWVHAKARGARDRAYLWLRREGQPQSAADIAIVAGVREHAIRETMRRDMAFVQVRPEGTWALTDWRLPATRVVYKSAVEVVLEVLRDLGPMTADDLTAETLQRYPVTTWRVQQCLSSAAIGLTKDGLYDLVERGATPLEESEPSRPDTIEVHGEVVGLCLPVDHEMVRGSGILVNRWLTWYLGLRTAPSTRYFKVVGKNIDITVRRNTSASQLSSLRWLVDEMNLIEGCEITLLFHLDVNTVVPIHTCAAATCPALNRFR